MAGGMSDWSEHLSLARKAVDTATAHATLGNWPQAMEKCAEARIELVAARESITRCQIEEASNG